MPLNVLNQNAPINSLNDTFTAKALALFKAASFYKDIGLGPLMVEGDALQVIQLLKNPAADWS